MIHGNRCQRKSGAIAPGCVSGFLQLACCVAAGEMRGAVRAIAEIWSGIARVRPVPFGTPFTSLATVLRRGDARRQDFARRDVARLGNWANTRSPVARSAPWRRQERTCCYRGFAGQALKARHGEPVSGDGANRAPPSARGCLDGTGHAPRKRSGPGGVMRRPLGFLAEDRGLKPCRRRGWEVVGLGRHEHD